MGVPTMRRRLARAAACLVLLTASLHAVARADGADPAIPSADVTLHEHPVFTLRRGDAAHDLTQRARRASSALAEVVEASAKDPVTITESGTRATVRVGATPIVELDPEDAALAGDSSLKVHAEGVAARVRRALAEERRRAKVAGTVFAASLVVFFGLVTLYLVRKLHALSARARRVLIRHPQRVRALRLKRLELMGPAALRSVLLLVVSLGHGLGVVGLGYTWLVLSLSLFARTRPLVEQLTGLVLSPLSSLVTRVAAALPLFVVVLVAFALTWVLVRIVALFFASVARGESTLAWLPAELAEATSLLARAGLVVFAMVFAGPVITGDPDGPIARTGMLVMIALAVATTPLLASLVAGVALAFSRGVRLGDQVEYGGRLGVVRAIGVVWMVLEDEAGASVRVPHVRALFCPTRVNRSPVRAPALTPSDDDDEAPP